MKIRLILQTLVLSVFFFSTLFITVGLDGLVNSPDENANLVFANTFSESLELSIINDGDPDLGGIIHPRSTIVLGGKIVPGSFIGLPIVYGLIGSILGTDFILFLTPILALLSIVAWRQVVKKWFGSDRLADFSAVLLMVHPAFWFYSGRVMMHNVAFVAFLIFALWFIFVRETKWQNLVLAGAMTGLALAFRTSEAIWIGVLVLWGAYFLYQKSKKIIIPIIFITSMIVVLIPFGIINHQTYGGFFETGYTVEVPSSPTLQRGDEGGSLADIESINEPLPGILGYVFPFGIHELAIVRNVYKYGFQLYPWMSVLVLLGLAHVVLKRKEDGQKPWKILSITLLGLSVWLAVVYGSWTFADNPDPKVISIGNSHVRYWIPLFVLGTPFIARAVLQITSRRLQILIIIAIVGLSFNLVFFGQDGFVGIRKSIHEFEDKKEMVVQHTEEDAIVIVDMADKFLWPERRVVVPLRSEVTYQSMSHLIDEAPLYYFGLTLPIEDLNYLNDVKLAEDSLKITPVLTTLNETLYHITNSYAD